MTLILTVFAAIIASITWYCCEKRSSMKLGMLVLIYWGASLMWMVDAVYGFIDEGAAFFTPPVSEVFNETVLGLSVIALGLIIWLVNLFVSDPEGKVKKALIRRK